MNIDVQTLLLASGAVVLISGFSFIVNTVLRRNDEVGRTWSIAFIGGILATLSYAVWNYAPGAWWTVAVGNGALTLSLAAMWSGARQFNDLRPLLGVSLGASGIVAIAALAEGPQGGGWAGAEEMFVGIAAFAALAASETMRRRFKGSLNARVLTVVLFGVALYYVVRTVVFLVDGENGNAFVQYFGTTTTTFVTIVLVILAAISMSVLATGRQNRGPEHVVGGGTPHIPGVLAKPTFDELGADWLARARRDRDLLVLVVVDISNLQHMNTAFGRDYGDQAIRSVGRIAVESSPTAALVAHGKGQRFFILTTAPAVGEAAAVVERLNTAMVETPIDDIEGIRATVTSGLASTDRSGYALQDLQRAALDALRDATAAGDGEVRHAPA